ncbi:LLM class flavin-dependent oxidoreductase [Shouchella clausii]|uniref:LLM class flavin-dependent oxidoreductase n=1 Tax=Shouchella clausii TaxID=79880 RepID=UPI000B97108E|nr:LLM class flavin-dependent oxidoreductase [Shouchella clausii]AST96105.1 monooxygenase [Shouchella clausii]MCR1289477.1 LLM class flavin-dependent oxidoreductase [Shouchella clausii]MEB5473708.1 LLM class flavin-dependent oxidoreductase [Shouchella clausii]MEB5479274.1 LLM class flavin-dependent oxidoreductase [Shouchella clausii]PAD14704.1 LLM class flavin-dependent oxidoreductase [Shouchella clausii]
MSKQMKLAAYLIGTGMHVASWRHPDAKPGASIDARYYQELANIAEQGRFDMVFLADSLAVNGDSHPNILNRFEPFILLAALAEATSSIGLGATASTSYTEPYNLARQVASIDMLSGGRAGWNVVTTGDATGETGLNFSRTEHFSHRERYERAEEFVDVVKGLWDSWEDDAFVFDKKEAVFYDPDKLHELNHQGRHFQVKGPLNIARSRQGQPVIIQAGSSEAGQQLAARTAEVVFSHKDNLKAAKMFYRQLKSRLAQFGREQNELVVLHAVAPIIGATEEEARRKHAELQALVPPRVGLRFLSGYMGNVDFSKYSLDTPAKEIVFPEVNGIKSQFDEMKRIIEEEDLRVGDLYERFTNSARVDEFVGTPTQVADALERWFKEGAADGFMLQVPLLPSGLEDFINEVVPILQERGLFRKEYTGNTLRSHLGLKKPTNRFSTYQTLT